MIILLIEDNPGDIYLIGEKFREIDSEYDMTTITNESNALNYIHILGSNPEMDLPDLIILDAVLPKASGLDILSVIRKTERLNNTCVIFMSGTSDPGYKDTALNMGAQEYFQKPEDLSEYAEIVSRIIQIANNKKGL